MNFQNMLLPYAQAQQVKVDMQKNLPVIYRQRALPYWENLNVKVLIPSDHLSCSVVPEKAAPTAMTLPTGLRLFRRLC